MQTSSLFLKNPSLRVARDSDVPALRRLVNAAYKELADMGLNYTATFQDEEITRRRLSEGTAYVLEKDSALVATVLLRKNNRFTGRNSAYVNQLAVSPDCKGQGLGSLMMDLCEALAREQGFEAIQLDTAKPAKHLVSWYLRRRYYIVGETQWEGKSYESWTFEKSLLESFVAPSDHEHR